MITEYHAKYYACELTRRCPSDSIQKLMVSLADAQVDLNPHQIDAALFAFRSPFSRGVLLADEVGLGKTIEAGTVLSQKWAEGRRKILIIVPSSLRKQWMQELAEKFFLPSVILESGSFNKRLKSGKHNPFDCPEQIVICSYHFARNKEEHVRMTNWDLVVIDEAHRLRNVYRTDNKIAKTIRSAIENVPNKVLLTATPLQNSLMELYGLTSFIDDHIFGDKQSFNGQFTRITDNSVFKDLRDRIQPVCRRTLRKQVLEYVPYTNRLALVQDFVPGEEEQRLYDLVSDYLRRGRLFALPASQRQLITLVLRKLLASSSSAISGSRTADKRAAIVDFFKDEAEIMIATESAAEGVNFQFCSLVVNYDLPWNPQRIEQRIGRCHRYGQKHDVVVVNFLNRRNAADRRVYELLDDKFSLFSGVFGVSATKCSAP